MSTYIYGRIPKDTMYARLVEQKSQYAILYKGSYPKADDGIAVWQSKIEKVTTSDHENALNLTYEEASAIAYWVYMSMKRHRKEKHLPKKFSAR